MKWLIFCLEKISKEEPIVAETNSDDDDLSIEVEKAMNAHELVKDPTIDQLLDIDQWARDFVLKEINETCRRL